MAFACSACQKSFRIRTDYNKHQKQHDRPFPCHLCSRAFALKTNLNRHKIAAHPTSSNDRVSKIKCKWPNCQTKTSREDYLLKHMRELHQKVDPSNAISEIQILEGEIYRLYRKSIEEARASVSAFKSTLHEAVAKGDENEVTESIAQGANINAEIVHISNGSRQKETPLSLSVISEHEKIFWILLKHNPSPRSLTWAFHASIQRKKCHLANALIEKGVSLEQSVTIRGPDTPLEMAARGKCTAMVKLLLSKGANSKVGKSLLLASLGNSKEIVELLLENGVSIDEMNREDGNRYSALGAASYRGHIDIVRLLVENGANINQKEGGALEAAAWGGNTDVVSLLIEHGANVNQESKKFGSVLGAASYRSHKEVIWLLLENAADINQDGGDYGSALGDASASGDEEIVLLLLENGADINREGGKWGCAIGVASFHGHYDVVRLLLDNGADINMKCGIYGSALGAAAKGGHDNVVLELLQEGANSQISIPGSGTPLQWVKKNNRIPTAALLRNYRTTE